MLGVEVEWETSRWRPAANQSMIAVRVADLLETCTDEWLDHWQESAVTSKFWDEVQERLTPLNKWWSNLTPTPVQIYKVAMTYTAGWDPKGRGYTEDEDVWGFRLGDLTWGDRKAEIDPDKLAKPWVRFVPGGPGGRWSGLTVDCCDRNTSVLRGPHWISTSTCMKPRTTTAPSRALRR